MYTATNHSFKTINYSWNHVKNIFCSNYNVHVFSYIFLQLLTADGGIIELGADVHFRIIDPMKSISCIIDMNRSLRVLVKALLTNQLVQRSLADIEKDKLQLLGLVQVSETWFVSIFLSSAFVLGTLNYFSLISIFILLLLQHASPAFRLSTLSLLHYYSMISPGCIQMFLWIIINT